MFGQKKQLAFLLALSPAWAGCGSDDGDDVPTGPVPSEADVLAVLNALGDGFQGVELAQLFSGEAQVLEGVQGQLVITITSWSFEQYSPDGSLVMDGLLTIAGLAPILVSGNLEMSGSQQGTVEVNMTVDIGGGVENVVLGGTVKFNGVEFDVAEVLANAPQDDAAPADSTDSAQE